MADSPLVLRQKEIGGINSYYKLGYQGNCNIMQLESPTSPHGTGVCNALSNIAPGVKIYRVGANIISNSDGVQTATCSYDGVTYTIEEFIKKFKVKIITESTGGLEVDKVMEAYWNDLKAKYNVILVAPTGNEGAGEVTTAFPISVAIQVGAISVSDKGVIKLCYYSGYDEIGEVDFVYFTGDLDGTSFSTPRICGVIALLLQRFGDRTQDEIMEMLKLLCVDMEIPGYDIRTGYGYPVLHEDDNKRLGKLAEMNVNGTLREIDVKKLPEGILKKLKAILYNGENYVRLRDFEDVLGIADIEYDATLKIPTVQD